MSCCGKKSQRRVVTAPKADGELDALRKAGEMVLVEYVGGNVGEHGIYGRFSGVRYRFSSLPGKNRQYVFVEDLPFLLAAREAGKDVYLIVEDEAKE